MKLAILAATLTVAAIPAAFADDYNDASYTDTYMVYGNDGSVDIYTGDLDLRSPAGRDEAAYRINIATDRACKPFPDIRVFSEVHHWRDCRADAFDDGMAQLDGRTPHHRRGRVITREYQGEPEPPPPQDNDDED